MRHELVHNYFYLFNMYNTNYKLKIKILFSKQIKSIIYIIGICVVKIFYLNLHYNLGI